MLTVLLHKRIFWLMLLLAPQVTFAEDTAISVANRLLFATDHLKNLATDGNLVYDFKQSGSQETPIMDTITLKLTSQDKHRQAQVLYLSGEQQLWTPTFDDPDGNPILLLFLQHDITEMQRINGGQWRHFQKYIKLALEQSAKVENVNFDYAGQTRHGQKIGIAPYVNDPDKDRFANKAYGHKTYEFIVSSEVPGGLYRISTWVPTAADKTSQPLSRQELVLR